MKRYHPQRLSTVRGSCLFHLLLHAEDGGMVMYVKRLEAGRFRIPEYDPDTKSYPMEWRDLVVMVEGITEDPASRLRRLRAERTEYHV
ncbi:MAG: IS66 family insertion sequence element accessory protein TnpB [Bacteroidales bacterium]|nr:IS66 family insertion sequence element accessory protein TnpB [Bacteroidales bacterium]